VSKHYIKKVLLWKKKKQYYLMYVLIFTTECAVFRMHEVTEH